MVPIKQTIIFADGRRFEVSRQGIEFHPGDSPSGMSKRAWQQLLIRAWRVAGQYWHKVILPKHFAMGAYQEYGYKARSTRRPKRSDRPSSRLSYVAAKQRYKGHQLPLVWSGELKRLTERIRDVRSDSKGARIVLHGPRYLWAYRKDLNQPDKAAELQAISQRDAEAIAAVMDRFLSAELGRPGGPAMGEGHQGEGLSIYTGHAAATAAG